ncbi:hypothetical protein [Nocardia concava]|uniref:hypothetical protein n=1 Tax=Nocardia concava TaxID=257281 RepID=UPI0002F3E240|nr:hypothetical protein [Nocardia concava]
MIGPRSLIAPIAALCAVLVTPAASAAPVTTFSPAQTLGYNAFPCFGTIDAFYDPENRFYGDDPTIWVRASMNFLPTGSAGWCGADAWLTWRNLDTGATGRFPTGNNVPLASGGPGTPAPLWVPLTPKTGSGRIEFTIETTMPHLPGSGTITVG